MCGRFGLFSPMDVIADLFGIQEIPAFEPRYNIAPSQQILAVCQKQAGERPSAGLFSWGLIPLWSNKPDFKLINARGETVAEKPAFRSAFRSRRCLIPADGFFEWKKVGREKQPHFFRLKSQKPFAIAGIYERIQEPVGPARFSCALVTTQANDVLRPIHHRMPVILRPQDFDTWMNRDNRDGEGVLPLIRPYPAAAMEGLRVGTAVNAASYDAPDCIEGSKEPPESQERTLFD